MAQPPPTKRPTTVSSHALVQPADVSGAGLPLSLGGAAYPADEEERHIFDFSDEPQTGAAADRGGGQRGHQQAKRSKRKGKRARGKS